MRLDKCLGSKRCFCTVCLEAVNLSYDTFSCTGNRLVGNTGTVSQVLKRLKKENVFIVYSQTGLLHWCHRGRQILILRCLS